MQQRPRSVRVAPAAVRQNAILLLLLLAQERVVRLSPSFPFPPSSSLRRRFASRAGGGPIGRPLRSDRPARFGPRPAESLLRHGPSRSPEPHFWTGVELKVTRDDIHEQGPPPAGQHHVFQKVQNDRLVRLLLSWHSITLPSDEHYLAVQRAEDAARERLVPCLVLLLQSVVL